MDTIITIDLHGTDYEVLMSHDKIGEDAFLLYFHLNYLYFLNPALVEINPIKAIGEKKGWDKKRIENAEKILIKLDLISPY